MRLEKDIIKQIHKRLAIYSLTGECEWYTRLQSGKVKLNKYFIKMCDPGTPDYLALVRGRNNNILALFIEAKSDNGKLRASQEEFKQKYGYKEGFWYLEIRDIVQLDNWFTKNAKDFVNLLPKEL